MADALRELYLGLQATRDQAAATVYSVPLNDIGRKTNYTRKNTEEYFGTLARARKTLKGGEYEGISLKSDLYYNWQHHLIASLLKLPTTIAYPGEATVVKQHTMKEAVNSPLLTIKFNDGVQSWQILNAVCSSGKWAMPEQAPSTVDFEVMGDKATQIGDISGSVPLALSNTDGPAGWPELLMRQGTTGRVTRIYVTAGGTGYAASGTLTFAGGGGGSGAAATYTAASGIITYITVTNEGSGYTAAPTISAFSGGGTGAAATVVIGGTPLDFLSADVTINRQRKPWFPSRRNTAPKRFIEPSLKADFTVNPDYTAVTGSLFSNFITNTSPGQLQFEWVGPTMIGGQSFPVFQINLPNPLITDGQDEVTKIPAMTPIKGEAGYDPTLGGAVQIVGVNDTAAYAAT